MSLQLAELRIDQIGLDETGREADVGLVESLAHFGLMRPIDVRAETDGSYALVDGSRRLDALRKLKRSAVTAIVEPASGAAPKDLKALVLNRHRESLAQLYVARHARRLLREEPYTKTRLARELSLGKSTLCQMLKVLECPDLVAALERGEIEFGAARALAAPPAEERKALLDELWSVRQQTRKSMPVRDVEERVRQRQGRAPLVEVAPGRLAEAVTALRDDGVPIEIRTVRGKQSGMKVTLTLTEADSEWLGELLEESGGTPIAV